MADDFPSTMTSIKRTPDDPIAQAARRAAADRGTPVRHWQMPQGARAWNAMRREHQIFERYAGVSQDSAERFLREMAQLAPDEWFDYVDTLGERSHPAR